MFTSSLSLSVLRAFYTECISKHGVAVNYRTVACRVVRDRHNAAVQAAAEQTEYRGTRWHLHPAEHPQRDRVLFQCLFSPRSALYTHVVASNYVRTVLVTGHHYSLCTSSIYNIIIIIIIIVVVVVVVVITVIISHVMLFPAAATELLTSRIRCRCLCYIQENENNGMSANRNGKRAGNDLMVMNIADFGDIPNVCRTYEMCHRVKRILPSHWTT